MGTPKEIIDLLRQAAETVGNKLRTDGEENLRIVEAGRKAVAARGFFSEPLIVEHTSDDDIPELPTPKTSLSERYQED